MKKCFDQANISILDMYISPLALADSILTDAEKRGGCVLVDLGADTTTVSVYHRNILRKLTVIPLGSRNITKDIASLQMEEEDAEKMKLKYASAYTDANDIDPTFTYPIDKERSIDMPKFVDIVEARVREIIENVRSQVPDEFADKLLGGIILTGGGSNMRNTERAFRLYTHIEKIRTAKFVNETIKSSSPIVNAKDGRLCTVLAILAEGDQNCAGNDITGDLFEHPQPKPAAQPAQPLGTQQPPKQTGKVIDEAETPQPTATSAQPAPEKTESKESKEEPKRTHKLFSKLSDFFRKMTEPDE